jgi:hypothetical protein
MKALGLCLSITALCAVAAACHSPTAATPGYAGEWAGTTAQGRPIAFTISPGEAVTSITVGHDFNGCSGAQTFSDLSLNIVPNVQCIPGPCPASLQSYRGFGYTSGNPFQGPSTDVNAVFFSVTSAQGSINFRSFPGCGSAIGVAWSATRR